MSPEAWTFAGIVVVQLTTAASLWLKLRRQHGASNHAAQSADAAAAAAEVVAVQTRPISNGFATSVLGGLQGLRDDVASLRGEVADVQRAMIRHLTDHAQPVPTMPRQRGDMSPDPDPLD